MTTPPAGGPYGPNDPNVPPPPPGGSYGAPPPPGQYGGPAYGGPEGQPPKKGKAGKIIAGIAAGIALILLLCCIGGFFIARSSDDESSSTSTSVTSSAPTSEPTTETSTETTSASPSTSSSAATGGADFPDEFDGWKLNADQNVAGQSTAVYEKGGDLVSFVKNDTIKPSDFEAAWSKDQKVGDFHCGTLAGTSQCAGEKGGSTYLASSPSATDPDELAGILESFLGAL